MLPKNDMTRFPEFLQLVRKKWPLCSTPRLADMRLEYEACVMQGISEDDILAGTEYYLDNAIPADQSRYYVAAPHTWLRQQSFLLYVPEPAERKLEAVK